MWPFSFAILLLCGLLVLEIIALLLGGSLLGGDQDAGIEAEASAGDADGAFENALDWVADGGFDTELDLSADLNAQALDDIVAAELTAFASQEAAAAGSTASDVVNSGPSAWLGLDRVPMMVWFAALLASFGLIGAGLQVAASELTGRLLPLWISVPLGGALGLSVTKRLAHVFARALPQTETQAISERGFGRRRGVVTQGTARRGAPAEVKIIDGYGNAHYLRAEPLRAEESIPRGSDVLVLRDHRNKTYRLISLSELVG